jgi:hypothetical protein
MAGLGVVQGVVHGLADPGPGPADHPGATTPRGGVDMRVPLLKFAPHILKALLQLPPPCNQSIPARPWPVSNFFLQVATV